MSALWKGTELEGVREVLRSNPATMLGYALGNVELRIFLLFGCDPECEDVPDEARDVAMRLVTALMGGADLELTCEDCAKIVQQWRDGRNVQ